MEPKKPAINLPSVLFAAYLASSNPNIFGLQVVVCCRKHWDIMREGYQETYHDKRPLDEQCAKVGSYYGVKVIVVSTFRKAMNKAKRLTREGVAVLLVQGEAPEEQYRD